MKIIKVTFLLLAFASLSKSSPKEENLLDQYLAKEKILMEFAYQTEKQLRENVKVSPKQLKEREKAAKIKEVFPMAITEIVKKLGMPDRIISPPGSWGDNEPRLLWEFLLLEPKGRYLRYEVMLSADQKKAVATSRLVLDKPQN